MERFERFRFSVPTVPLGKGLSVYFRAVYEGDGTFGVGMLGRLQNQFRTTA